MAENKPVFEVPSNFKELTAFMEKQRSNGPHLTWIHENAKEKDLDVVFEEEVAAAIVRSERLFIDLLININTKRRLDLLNAFALGAEKPNWTAIDIDWTALFRIRPVGESPTSPICKKVWVTAIERVLNSLLGYETNVQCCIKDVNDPYGRINVRWDRKL